MLRNLAEEQAHRIQPQGSRPPSLPPSQAQNGEALSSRLSFIIAGEGNTNPGLSGLRGRALVGTSSRLKELWSCQLGEMVRQFGHCSATVRTNVGSGATGGGSVDPGCDKAGSKIAQLSTRSNRYEKAEPKLANPGVSGGAASSPWTQISTQAGVMEVRQGSNNNERDPCPS